MECYNCKLYYIQLGADYWTTLDKRLLKGTPFSALGCGLMLLELGIRRFYGKLKFSSKKQRKGCPAKIRVSAKK